MNIKLTWVGEFPAASVEPTPEVLEVLPNMLGYIKLPAGFQTFAFGVSDRTQLMSAVLKSKLNADYPIEVLEVGLKIEPKHLVNGRPLNLCQSASGSASAMLRKVLKASDVKQLTYDWDERALVNNLWAIPPLMKNLNCAAAIHLVRLPGEYSDATVRAMTVDLSKVSQFEMLWRGQSTRVA